MKVLVAQPCLTLCQLVSLLCPWNFPGENTGVNCHALLQGISANSLRVLGLLSIYSTLRHKRSVKTLYLCMLKLDPRHWWGKKKRPERGQNMTLACTHHWLCAKFPVKIPRSRCTCVEQRRAELKNNSWEESWALSTNKAPWEQGKRLYLWQTEVRSCGARPLSVSF